MVKHTKTFRRQQPTNCLSVLDHFVELALKGLISHIPKCEVITFSVNRVILIQLYVAKT